MPEGFGNGLSAGLPCCYIVYVVYGVVRVRSGSLDICKHPSETGRAQVSNAKTLEAPCRHVHHGTSQYITSFASHVRI